MKPHTPNIARIVQSAGPVCRPYAIFAILFMVAVNLVAAADGTLLTGRVSNAATGAYLEGARIEVKVCRPGGACGAARDATRLSSHRVRQPSWRRFYPVWNSGQIPLPQVQGQTNILNIALTSELYKNGQTCGKRGAGGQRAGHRPATSRPKREVCRGCRRVWLLDGGQCGDILPEKSRGL